MKCLSKLTFQEKTLQEQSCIWESVAFEISSLCSGSLQDKQAGEDKGTAGGPETIYLGSSARGAAQRFHRSAHESSFGYGYGKAIQIVGEQ